MGRMGHHFDDLQLKVCFFIREIEQRHDKVIFRTVGSALTEEFLENKKKTWLKILKNLFKFHTTCMKTCTISIISNKTIINFLYRL